MPTSNFIRAVFDNDTESLREEIRFEDYLDRKKWKEFTSPLHIASSYGYLEVTKILLENGVDVNCVEVSEWGGVNYTALHAACKYDQADIAEYLLKCGADPDVWGIIQYDAACMTNKGKPYKWALRNKSFNTAAVIKKHVRRKHMSLENFSRDVLVQHITKELHMNLRSTVETLELPPLIQESIIKGYSELR